jgi:hypothetical protein
MVLLVSVTIEAIKMTRKEKIAALAKMAELPKVLEAATLLNKLGLQDEKPTDTVKRYVQANPDLNELLQAH